MPMFDPDCPDIVDRSGIVHKGMERWGFNSSDYPTPETKETIGYLRTFRIHGRDHARAFGHIAYLPEYAKAVQAVPTKVVFNMRDPRDVVIAEVAYIKIYERLGEVSRAWLNYRRVTDGKRIHELSDPISEMIRVDAVRWRNWIGWLDHDFTIPLHYEELRLRPLETAEWLTEALEGCELSKPPEQMAEATGRGRKPGSTSPSFRKGKVGEWKRYFRDRHKKLAKELMGDIIERLGYEI